MIGATKRDTRVSWDLIQLVCGDCGEALEIKEGQWGIYYSCSTYPKCYNRLTIEIYEKILDKIVELLSEYPDTNFTGLKWEFKTSYQHFQFRIRHHRPDKFVVEALNVRKSKTKY